MKIFIFTVDGFLNTFNPLYKLHALKHDKFILIP